MTSKLYSFVVCVYVQTASEALRMYGPPHLKARATLAGGSQYLLWLHSNNWLAGKFKVLEAQKGTGEVALRLFGSLISKFCSLLKPVPF